MKKIILSAGKRLKKLLQSGSVRHGRSTTRGSASTEITKTVKPVEEQKVTLSGEEARQENQQPAEAEGPPTKGRYRKPKPVKPSWSLEHFQVVAEEGKSRFHDFAIPLKVMRAISDLNFEYCTVIQQKALEDVLAGSDLVGKANTGTGKTAVFIIAILSRLLGEKKAGKGRARALVLAPTRELVVQIAKDARLLAKYSGLNVRVAYGGVDYQKQQDVLKNSNCDLLIATPGRLIDFIGKRVVDLSRCKILVLDEADRMLDMGFIPDVRRIVGRLPAAKERQTMFFSATVPEDVQRLVSQWCVKPKVVEAEPEQVAVETVKQFVYLTTTEEKYSVLYNLIKASPDDRIMVFANMKNETRRLADRLQRNGVDCVLLSGDVAQNKRSSRLERFREGKVKILVATDVAGRGIHIEGITLVVNYTLPYEPEDYVHRIGRTGRAGASGNAVSFACEEGAFYLPEIEEYLGHKFDCVVPPEELLTPPPPQSKPGKAKGAAGRYSKSRRRPGKKTTRSFKSSR
jgi:ATP-dependent RNA helicase RhlB